ncbi:MULTISPECIES: alpha/beta hydrolase [unclassified Mesorhizobium]|uniref:alpha/beta hydrolase n=1 Tax=unclassified Mesorhizobium TaxID=325217 RepID=UPI00112C7EF2|nr:MULTISPECIES: alpha/beta hydrolase [unclassified Mesorhizobium]TPI52117.1 alpha/beta hydrolase [Mesorhizobium sp. B3-1-1]TPJ60281.1 alpha/beta hydrolase [Mesorhizobium sp. B2-6-1]TPJ60424.1 alpha/beta hydrolase [Mesorhizobium sp. B2-6-7]TPJ83435.1 alpha/beta hydrolase [Mesorhizobium sp. B2-6-3]TPJ97495.1 alpha/beta hydrolase [Mesorhizobium sp. B2-5-10]
MGLANEAGYVFRDRYPEREHVYRRFDEASAAARASFPCRRDVPYGAHPRQIFDLFPGSDGAPLVVFVHGGYWQSLDKDRYSFVAAALVPRGFSVALLNYPLAPAAGVAEIVESVRGCLPMVLEALRPPPPFWIATGHSAGGHLAAMLAMTSHAANVALAACAPISGIFDLEPLVETSLNAALELDQERAAKLSPIRRRPMACPLTAFVGAAETSDFAGQSRQFVEHWRAAGQHAELVSLRDKNHYTVLCDLLEERSEIAEGIMRLAQAFRREEKRVEWL